MKKVFLTLIVAFLITGCAGYQTTLTMRVDKIWHSGDVVKVNFVHDMQPDQPMYSELSGIEQTATVSYLPDDPFIREIYVGDLFKMSCAKDGLGMTIFDETCKIIEKMEK